MAVAGLWEMALAGDEAARVELAGRYWYPVYAYFRAMGLDAAAERTEGVLTRLVEERVLEAPLLREYLLALAKEEVMNPATLAIDRAWAEERFATEGAHPPEEMFARRWTMGMIEAVLSTLEAEYAAAGKGEVFAAMQPMLGFSGGGDEPYGELAATLGMSDGAARRSVFDLRTRYRDLLRAAVADTVASEELIGPELQTLLVELPPPTATVPPRSILRKVNAEELLARGMNSVQMSTVGGLGWTPPTVAEAARLFPGYEVVAMLGHGGMGAVYQARQESLDRLVAIKLLPLEISVDASFADRFRREARAMARLNHPNIIAVYDFGQTGEGHLFFVMEFVDGAMLHDLIHRESPLSAPDALAIVEQVCEALAFAHEQGIVHRDIKPANVMVDARGRAKVADFGLARLTDPAQAEQWGNTMTGIVMGTPDYMSPEQKRGQHVDHRADIYSVGVMLYEALCRETPQGAFELPSQRCGLPKEVDAIITRAIAPQPEKRFQSTMEMKAAMTSARPSVIKATQRKQPPKAPTPHVASLAPAPRAKKPVALWVGVAAGVLALAAAGMWLLPKGRPAASPLSEVSAKPARAPIAWKLLYDKTKFPSKTAAWDESIQAMRWTVGHIATAPVTSPDHALRATYPEGATEPPRLWIRRTLGAGENSNYELRVKEGKLELVLIRLARDEKKPQAQVLATAPLPSGHERQREYTIELHARGSELTGLFDDTQLLSATDAALPQGGAAFYLVVGSTATRLESADLGPAPAEKSQPLPPNTRLLWRTAEGVRADGQKVRWEEGALRLDEARKVVTLSSADCILRARIRQNSEAERTELHLRQPPGDVGYILRVGNASAEICVGREFRSLGRWPLRRQMGADDWPLFEFKAVGDELSVMVDGEELGKVRDRTLSQAGEIHVYAKAAGYFRDISVTELGPALGAPAAGPSPAAVNFLGMKFVPVPIVGGPTAGQRVLFSIWNTRVQDYAAFAAATNRSVTAPDFPQEPTHPVVKVSWVEATAFCAWLSKKEGRAYRLPSDHEWSCAAGIGDQEDAAQSPKAKSGQVRAYCWLPPGSTFSAPKAEDGNFTQTRVSADAYEFTSPVGSFPANQFGLFDIGGNVVQWCADWHDPAVQTTRVMRGSNYRLGLEPGLRLSKRMEASAPESALERGFRCVLVEPGG